MAGRWTPARVYVAGALPYVINGVRAPLPFTALGTPDTAFESAYRQEVAVLASWSRRNGVHLLHLPWYGALYNEFYLGPEVLRAPGYTYQAWLNAHERLAQIAWQFAGSDLTIEFPLSGIDDSAGRTVYSNLSSYANALAASSPTRLFVQTNGLGQPQFGLRVFGRGITVGHAQQMYNGADYDWSIIFTLVRASHDTYLEIYVTSFSPSLVHHALLMVQVASFR
jgi:hypothetical protein